jgi:hypothetical protein
MHLIQLENIKEFSKRTNTSKSTLYRFYNSHPSLWDETKVKNNKRLFPTIHEKYFKNDLLIQAHEELKKEVYGMKNLLHCLKEKNSLPSSLWHMDWSYFVTIAYRDDRSKKHCYSTIAKMQMELEQEYGYSRVFFTTEPFTNRKGYHNHCVIHVPPSISKNELEGLLKNSFAESRIDVQPYNECKAGIFYIAKNGLVGEDWDILWSNEILPNNLN